ncbi:MAG: hypothetical protein U5K76_08370 [Woeseiaceae bacterium]|nr:hypothetical protein [Woeseiaceae bacterium]
MTELPRPNSAARSRKAPSSAVRRRSVARSQERKIQALVADSRSCETDDDCTIFDYGYPIQCLTSVAKSEITRLRLQYREYEADCEFRVYYDCPSEPMERKPVCRNNRCEVELQTHDLLRDETFEYLGIDESQ